LNLDKSLNNCIRTTRSRLSLSQQQLAEAAGVTRQTIGGIEAGQYSPSATVALKLARALGCRVEDLFWLDEDLPTVDALLAAENVREGDLRVSLARVGGRWVAHPLAGDAAFRTEMVPADGIGKPDGSGSTLSVKLVDEPETLSRTVVVAGCTPALSLWARSAERWQPGLRLHWVHANSMEALESLARGEVHAAGVHLLDPATGEYNAPYVRQMLPGRRVALVNLGVWEEGLVVAAGNPKRLSGAADLAGRDVRIVNRDEGSGARLLLDTLLSVNGVSPAGIAGYGDVAKSHEEVVRAVAAGRTDAGVSTASMAGVYGLGFVALREVRFDLAIPEEYLEEEPVKQLLDTLHHRWVRTQLRLLGGYDTSATGEIKTLTDGPQQSTKITS
jgi:putative molybdopterin biosynthesis protein